MGKYIKLTREEFRQIKSDMQYVTTTFVATIICVVLGVVVKYYWLGLIMVAIGYMSFILGLIKLEKRMIMFDELLNLHKI